jgi:type IV secretion system protein VirD4
MNKRVTQMPIEDSPWIDQQSSDDVVNYAEYFRGLGVKVVDLLEGQKSTAADSFQTGAQQAVARFNITTRAHKKTKRSSFRFSEQKEGDKPTTVFIVADAARIEAQKQVLGLIQWCMLLEHKRHKNHHRPVYLIADEATNFKLHDLGNLLTWGRGYGLRLHLIIQNLPAFRKVYGKDVLRVKTQSGT